jgi:protein-tyrosine-phosphatase
MPDPYILVLCSANVCRSPMAEKLLQHALKAEQEPLRSWKVISAGLGAIDGEPASRNSVEAIRKVGLQLDNHRSRIVTEDLLRQAKAVFVMTRSHLRMLEMVHGPVPPHVHLFRAFLPAAAGNEIPDPFGQNLAAYEACRDSMVEAVPSIIAHLRTLAG